MGGGRRAFPGGINKWQWKQLHDMRAKENEKQLYQAHLRYRIRCYSPMSPEGHFKVLADRFAEAGAEDFWYEDDGPGGRNESTSSPNYVRKLVPRGRNLISASMGSNYVKNRSFSAESGRPFRGSDSSLSEGKSSFDSKYESSVRTRNYVDQFRRRFRKTWSSSSDDDSSDDLVDDSTLRKRSLSRGKSSDEDVNDSRQMSDIKKGSSASLGKFDTKLIKGVSLDNLEMEIDYSGKNELIRHEVRKRNLDESEKPVLSVKRFDECGVSSLTVKALSDAGFCQMSRMQEATLAVALEGNDALVRAKTSTGKSLAFLLPAIEAVMKAMSCKTTQQVPPVYVLVLCPTRELVSLIAAEAKVLLKYHDGIGVQTLVGATRFKLEEERLESDPCQIIVATPGRLLDHIESKTGLSARLMGLEMLILDEVNHLLDLGFWEDIEKIVDCLPRRRQSLLFSAAIPNQVCQISQVVLKKGHAIVDTVGLGFEESCVKDLKVKQSFLIAPHDQHFQIVHYLLKEHILQVLDYKVIVFCSTAMVTSFMHLLLREMKMNVREIHSLNTQLDQIRISDEFREAKQLILVSSDVSAHEMNYPDVTLVIQVGIPLGREEYIQRLQRIGRRGRVEGVLLLAPWEEYFLDKLEDHPLEGLPLPSIDPNILLKTKESMARIDTSVKEAAYHAWLRYYNSIEEIGRDKITLFELGNQFCESIGLQNPPPLSRKTTLKMGLKDISGIRIQK